MHLSRLSNSYILLSCGYLFVSRPHPQESQQEEHHLIVCLSTPAARSWLRIRRSVSRGFIPHQSSYIIAVNHVIWSTWRREKKAFINSRAPIAYPNCCKQFGSWSRAPSSFCANRVTTARLSIISYPGCRLFLLSADDKTS